MSILPFKGTVKKYNKWCSFIWPQQLYIYTYIYVYIYIYIYTYIYVYIYIFPKSILIKIWCGNYYFYLILRKQGCKDPRNVPQIKKLQLEKSKIYAGLFYCQISILNHWDCHLNILPKSLWGFHILCVDLGGRKWGWRRDKDKM